MKTSLFVRLVVAFHFVLFNYTCRIARNNGWNISGCQSFLNQPLLCYAHEITNPVLLIHGEKAHSRYFSETAFEKMTGKKPVIPAELEKGKNWSLVVGNKELYLIPGAVHTALYDNQASSPMTRWRNSSKRT